MKVFSVKSSYKQHPPFPPCIRLLLGLFFTKQHVHHVKVDSRPDKPRRSLLTGPEAAFHSGRSNMRRRGESKETDVRLSSGGPTRRGKCGKEPINRQRGRSCAKDRLAVAAGSTCCRPGAGFSRTWRSGGRGAALGV